MHAQQYHFRSKVVPRSQWNYNSGYCGETSFICAGLNFGQYCSQWTARMLASPYPQYQARSQLLLGSGNDLAAAKEMRLRASEFTPEANPDPHELGAPADTNELIVHELIVWAKMHLVQGHVPIIGVFNNVIALGESPPGDTQYDHIVPVLGFASDWPLEVWKDAARYHASDVITLSDNGLYGPVGDPERYPFLYSYEVAGFQGTRDQANNPDEVPLYTLSNLSNIPQSDGPQNYGIAIEGVLDHDGHCIPVRLTCDKDYEPDPAEMPPTPDLPPYPLAQTPLANEPPVPITIRLTASVELPDPSVAYNLYRYDDFAQVPVAGFNAAAGNASQVWSIPAGYGPTYVVETEAWSYETVVFRAVPVSAP